MSMRDYAVEDYGMVLDNDAMRLIAAKALADFSEDEEYDLQYELYEKGLVEYISEFTGEAIGVDGNETSWKYSSLQYNGDSVCYVPLSKTPSLFGGGYRDMSEIVEEMRAKVGEYLPVDFDYKSRICHICGTYYG